MDSVKDKVVLITGASSGIGAGTAVLFAKYGSRLVLTGRNEVNLNKTAEQCCATGLDRSKVKTVLGDVTNDKDLDHIVEECITTFGGIDILVNNAAGGFGRLGNIQSLSMDDFELTYKTCLRAVVYLTRLVIPHLKKNKGSVVNVSSVVSYLPITVGAAYGMMKSALDMFTRDLSLELAPDGVRVNSVNPAIVRTPLPAKILNLETDEEIEQYFTMAGKEHPLGRVGYVDEVARAIIFLASDASSFSTGTIFPVDGGYSQGTSGTESSKLILKHDK